MPLLLLPLASADLTKISSEQPWMKGELINRHQLSLLLIDREENEIKTLEGVGWLGPGFI